jgi:hypothetical protein
VKGTETKSPQPSIFSLTISCSGLITAQISMPNLLIVRVVSSQSIKNLYVQNDFPKLATKAGLLTTLPSGSVWQAGWVTQIPFFGPELQILWNGVHWHGLAGLAIGHHSLSMLSHNNLFEAGPKGE